MSPTFFAVLGTVSNLVFLAIGIVLLVRVRGRSRQDPRDRQGRRVHRGHRGRGALVGAALMLCFHGIVGALFQVLSALHPAAVAAPAPPPEETPARMFTYMVLEPLWMFSHFVLVPVIVLLFVVGIVRSGATRSGAAPSNVPPDDWGRQGPYGPQQPPPQRAAHPNHPQQGHGPFPQGHGRHRKPGP